jgi:hypothetical protein
LPTYPVYRDLTTRKTRINYVTLPLNRILPATYLALMLVIMSCGNTGKSTSGLEGKIIYDISFPFEQNSVMLDLYPKEMIFHFKKGMMHSEVKSSYDLLTTDFIIDNENRVLVQLLKNMSERYGMKLNESETRTWNRQYPEVRLEPTGETETIAGYVCNKTIARFVNDSLPPIELYHTKGIGLDASNWWNSFEGVDGFLMGYDIEQYGMRMRLRAREVNFQSIDDSEFAVSDKFEMTNSDSMKAQLTKVVSEFMN